VLRIIHPEGISENYGGPMKVYLVVWNYRGYKYAGQNDVDSIFRSKSRAENRVEELMLDKEVNAWIVEYDVADMV
jgi:hypothetical protein